MIIKNNKTTSAYYKGTKEIEKRYKGTIVIYEAWKELTKSEVPPITLQKCKGVDLVDYKIYGDSVQNGTPTPDAPIEVESVGDKTKNYLDIEHLGNINNWDTEPTYASYEITLPNGNYVFNFETDLKSYNGHILILNKRKSASGGATATFINGSYNIQSKQGSFTISDNEKIYLNWYCGSKNQSNLTKLINDVLNNFIIEQGDTFTGYEPYGYRIPVKVSGKNLIDIEDSSANTSSSTFDITSLCPKGVPITLSANLLRTLTGKTARVRINYVVDGTTKYLIGNTITTEGFSYLTGVIPVNATSISITMQRMIDANGDIYYSNVQLERGSIPTDYEPYVEPITTNIYLNEPLRKIGDYVDYIDFENRKVVRNVGYHKFNSDVKDFHYNSNLNSTMYGNAITNKKIGHTEIKSNRFIPSTDSTKLYTIGYILGRSSSNIVSFVIPGDLATTSAEVQNWLENNSVNVCYPLEKTTEEKIDLPNIPTHKGTNIIEVDTNILPSNMEVVYWGKGKLEKLEETENIILNSILDDDTETEIDITDTEINQILDEIIGG